MSKLILCLGSNMNAEENMANARRLLKASFEDIIFTANMTTTPVGIEAAMFTNCMAQATTQLSYSEIHNMLKKMEQQCGDSQELREQNQVCMDIDLLQLGRKRYKHDDWERSYVKLLKKQIDNLASNDTKR